MAHDVLIVTEAELRAALELDLSTIDVIEEAFRALTRRHNNNPYGESTHGLPWIEALR